VALNDKCSSGTSNETGIEQSTKAANANIETQLFAYIQRLQALSAGCVFAWRWPVDIRKASVYLFEKQRAFRAEIDLGKRFHHKSLSLSGYESLRLMFAKLGQPGTDAWSNGPFARLPTEAFLMAYIFRHQQFAVERLLSFAYLAGAGFVDPAAESLDAAEINLQESEEMLAHLAACS
jgi:hypothetical protein